MEKTKKHHEENICMEMIHNLCKDGDFDISILKTKLIDQENAEKLYQFALQFVETSVTFEEFLSLLKYYEHAAVGITKIDKTIIGMIVYGAEIDVIDGKQFNLLTSGLAFVDSNYHGSIFYVATAAYFNLRELLLHPTMPLYNIVKCFTYKGFMLGQKHFKTTYPRLGVKTPEWEQKVMAKFGKRIEGRFIESNGVIQRERTKISKGIADITDKDLVDPNVKFFCEQNPGWHKGHGLIVVGPVTWEDVANLVQKAAARSRRHSNTYRLIPKSNL